MSDEAFANSEKLFRDAFALSDPAAELLNLLKAHPSYPAVVDLLVYYTDVVEENPSRAKALASALVVVRDSPDAPIIGDATLAEYFNRKLADLHSRGLEMSDDTETFGPTNTYLAASLLSGFSLKYGLTSSSDQYASIVESLDASDNSSTSEVIVIGACIQLLTNGSGIIPAATSYIKSANEVAAKLKAQKSAGTVKDSNALAVLELAISHAESGFKKENDIDNVWELLFPLPT
ncbi:unnamed protein product [Cyclocybe aegerita]|uniref:Uncharacterized protein n=1 Tax=Cyclocybe aegerita TaxID=1973307 RepID=A0A8S0WFN4_CYCAE|nr:unnamed protein product [Cyclocybe aegerita]